jgi:hypothetical protein
MLSYLNNVEDFEASKKILIEKGLIVKEYKDLGLYIVKYNKGENVTLDDDAAKCRGLIMDYSNNVVCIPPMKSIDTQYLPTGDIVYEEFIDGTMINVFYHNGWHISTRSCIGANCRWYSNTNFSDMFDESKTFDINKLDPIYCYNFVLKHRDNRIVTNYQSNDIVLVGAFEMKSQNYIDTNFMKEYLKTNFNIDVEIPIRYQFDNIQDAHLYASNLNFEQLGLVLKIDKWRSKLSNPHYNYVKYLRGNNRNIKYTYFELRRAGLLNEYLNYYPEYDEQFNKFTKELYAMTRKLFNYYQNFRVRKTITYEQIEYPYRPLLYTLHGDYLKTKNIISFVRVKEFVNAMPSAQILFVLNYKEAVVATEEAVATEETEEVVATEETVDRDYNQAS